MRSRTAQANKANVLNHEAVALLANASLGQTVSTGLWNSRVAAAGPNILSPVSGQMPMTRPMPPRGGWTMPPSGYGVPYMSPYLYPGAMPYPPGPSMMSPYGAYPPYGGEYPPDPYHRRRGGRYDEYFDDEEDDEKPDAVELTTEQKQAASVVGTYGQAVASSLGEMVRNKGALLELSVDAVNNYRDHQTLISEGNAGARFFLAVCAAYLDLHSASPNAAAVTKAFMEELRHTISKEHIATLSTLAAAGGAGGNHLQEVCSWLTSHIHAASTIPPSTIEDIDVEDVSGIGGISLSIEGELEKIRRLNEKKADVAFKKEDGLETVVENGAALLQQNIACAEQLLQACTTIANLTEADVKGTEITGAHIMLAKRIVAGANGANGNSFMGGFGSSANAFGLGNGGFGSGGFGTGAFGGASSPFGNNAAFGSSFGNGMLPPSGASDTLKLATVKALQAPMYAEITSPAAMKLKNWQKNEQVEQAKALAGIQLYKIALKVMSRAPARLAHELRSAGESFGKHLTLIIQGNLAGDRDQNKSR